VQHVDSSLAEKISEKVTSIGNAKELFKGFLNKK
jgi:hypothetical protein